MDIVSYLGKHLIPVKIKHYLNMKKNQNITFIAYKITLFR